MTRANPRDPLLDALSPSQREAVTTVRGHLLVLAGAGSGKTRVITHRIAHLLRGRLAWPREILAVTFTNKAAREMRERVQELLERDGGGDLADARDLWISTFHSLGARLLRRHPREVGLESGFSIFDETDTQRLIRRIYKELGVDSQRLPIGGTRGAISRWKSQLLEPGEVEGQDPLADRRRVQVYQRYQEELRRQNAADFTDLIVLPVKLLGSHEELRDRYRSRFRYVLVDEYQDTDRAQYLFVRHLVGEGTQLCAVGDEDQSIYGWRGAEIRNILDFREDFPAVRVLQLEKNYRCPNEVLEAANCMISNNRSRMKEREVWSDKRSRQRPAYFLAETAEQEAAWVAEAIRWMCMEEGHGYQDCAVFYRTHAQARAIEQMFLQRGIPYRVFGGLKFFERKAIKDLICYLRLVVNIRDREALLRVINEPRRGIGAKGIQKLLARADEQGVAALEALEDPTVLGGKAGKAGAALTSMLASLREDLASALPVDLLRRLLEELGYRAHLIATQRGDDMELVEELENAMVDHAHQREEPTLQGFLEAAALVSPTDELEDESGRVSLMTLHNAKGLEFPLVFVTGLEEWILPHANSLDSEEQLEEERRLLYVGMTRTEDRLFLSSSRLRTVHGKRNFRPPSRFLEEIGAEHLDLGEEEF